MLQKIRSGKVQNVKNVLILVKNRSFQSHKKAKRLKKIETLKKGKNWVFLLYLYWASDMGLMSQTFKTPKNSAKSPIRLTQSVFALVSIPSCLFPDEPHASKPWKKGVKIFCTLCKKSPAQWHGEPPKRMKTLREIKNIELLLFFAECFLKSSCSKTSKKDQNSL